MNTSYPPYYAYPSAPPLQRVLAKPPRLPWGWVLILSVLTLGIFGNTWLLVQANWIRKMRGGSKSTAFWVALANVIWLPVVFLFALGAGLVAALFPSAASAGMVSALEPIVRIGSLVLYETTAFTMRSELQAEPIGLGLSGVMTFLFAPFYFQYNLSDYGTAQEQGTGLGLSRAEVSAGVQERAGTYPTAAEVGVRYPPLGPPPKV